jgi:LAS superfamily LD-carboxypeptidase LdcB/putative cell wall-binding protein
MVRGGCVRGWFAASALAVSAALATAAPAHADTTTDRISGADRYATSVAVSRMAFPTAGTVGTVYLVSGETYADGLSAGPAAVADGAAMLLTEADRLTPAVAAELTRLAPERIVVVGLESALSEQVVTAARLIAPTVERVGGPDRYATSEALARSTFGTAGATTAYIATGRGYADALAAGPAAGGQHSPVVLVDGTASTLAPSVRALLADLGVTSVTIAGGTGVVSTGIEAGLRSALGVTAVARASGTDRYKTAIAVNRAAFPSLTPGDAYVAAGDGYADALSVSVLAGRSQRPLYLSIPYCAPTALRSELSRTAATRVRLVGGPGAIRGLVGSLEACRGIDTASSPWAVVNKKRRLDPSTYTPSSLVKPNVSSINGHQVRSDAAAALESMFKAARTEGAGGMALLSGYRSYSTQVSLYDAKLASAGRTEADKWVARPGHSEHQTGLAVDISPVGASNCGTYTCIGSTPQGRWLAANAWRFGFVLRYESGKTSVTGYNPEPWHFRFVGTAASRDYHQGSFHTLEQYFGLPAAPRY